MLLKLKRLYIIIDVLNHSKSITTDEILLRVNLRIGESFSKSTIEKDLFQLRMDFDCEIKGNQNGLFMSEKVDFFDRLKQHIH